ncbi:hypothetical protein SynA1560_02898 [Synechococcus sp. A15-60]|nr:hypothetical protein SynA1560_02898 [Synechococcus sp. A15-60]
MKYPYRPFFLLEFSHRLRAARGLNGVESSEALVLMGMLFMLPASIDI